MAIQDFHLAVQHHQAGRLAEAERLYRRSLAGNPKHADSLHLLGLVSCQTGRFEDAVTLIRQAIRLESRLPAYHNNLASALKALGRFQEAADCCRRALAIKPDYAEARYNLGIVLRGLGQPEAAAICFVQLLALHPGDAEVCWMLGCTLQDLDRSDEAAERYRQALALQPDYAEAHYNLGTLHQEQGRTEEAMACYRQTLAIKPDCLEAAINLGNLLQDQGQAAEAMAGYQRLLALRPDCAEAYINLGNLFQDQNRLEDAILRYEQALALKPEAVEAHNNIAKCLQAQGRLEEAIARLERVLELQPDHAAAHSNLLFARMQLPATTLPDALAAACRWDERHGEGLRALWPRHPPKSGREIRLGFVSGDFRRHAVGFLTIAALEGLAQAGHRFVCYTNSTTDDALTARFRSAAALWRPISGLSDPAAATLIRADGIDLLFDLSGHSAKNRLPLFARKPAPVQLTWAGYFATTGLAAMDYWLADRHQVPATADPWYREKIIRMPAGYICWEPPAEAPEVSDLPAARNGFVTFGSFNALRKITPQAVAVWSRILAQVPGSRLLLKAPSFTSAGACERYRALFAAAGIAPERLDFVGATSRSQQFADTGAVDIALDSFPYCGGLTTLETLWMGVPVITLPGETLCSRHSYGYLTTLGLEDMVAASLEDYVALAVAWAEAPARLAAARAGLRGRMLASPVLDVPGFVRAFETACRTVWDLHQTGQAPRSIDVGVGQGL